MTDLSHRLDRTITINATRETVFRFFTDSARWASWWGAGSTIDARPGGDVRIVYPGGVEVSGQVLEVASPERIVFSYGFVSGQIVPPGGSRVTIRLAAAPEGTRLHLVHEFAEAAARDHHVQGWRYQLALFGNVVANEAYAGATATVDGWFSAWAIDDEREREAALARLVDPAFATGIASASSMASRTYCPTSARPNGSCPASGCSARARSVTVRERSSPIGPLRARTGRSE